MSRLHPVKATNLFCGIIAVSAITGVEFDRVLRRYESVTGKPCKGICYLGRLRTVLSTFGTDAYRMKEFKRPTLLKWLSTNTDVCLVRVGHHFIAVDGTNVVDSAWTHGAVMPLESLPSGLLRKRVTHAVYVKVQA